MNIENPLGRFPAENLSKKETIGMPSKRSTFILVSGSFSLLFALVLVLLLSLTAPEVQAASPSQGLPVQDYQVQYEITSTVPYTIYVPLTLKGGDPAMPHLVSPVDGAVLDTLIPHFVFDAGTHPENTGGVLDFSTDPDPNRTDWMSSFSLQTGDHWDSVAWYNLEPNTTYYWRVGVIENYDYDKPPKWTDQWSFTTGPAGGVILPAPALTSPADNSEIPGSQAVLQWAAVPGAEGYAVTIHDFDEGYWYGWETTEPQVDLSGDSWMLRSGGHYEWYVEARNSYAWGPQSASWKFNITSLESSQRPQAQLPDRLTRVYQDGKWLVIAK